LTAGKDSRQKVYGQTAYKIESPSQTVHNRPSSWRYKGITALACRITVVAATSTSTGNASKLPQSTKAKLALVNTSFDNTGTFTLTTDDKPTVAVVIYDLHLEDFTTDDTSAEFIYNSWESVGKTQMVEISINKDKLNVTVTFWYADLITGVYSSKLPSTCSFTDSIVRTAPCTWKVKV